MLVPLLSLYYSACLKLSSIFMTGIGAWCKTGGINTAACECVADGILGIFDALIWRLTTSMISIRQSSLCSLDRHFFILLATPCRLRSISLSSLFSKLVIDLLRKIMFFRFLHEFGRRLHFRI